MNPDKTQGGMKEYKEGAKREGFCGRSTYGKCSSDADCIQGGCSGQICHSKYDERIITTCEYRDCYNAQAYNLKCKCVAGKCQWMR